MAIEHFDGFDEYSTAQLNRHWHGVVNNGTNDNIVIGSGNGRNSGNALRIKNLFINSVNCSFVVRSLANSTTRTIGLAFKLGINPTAAVQIFGMSDNGTVQVSVVVNSNFTISVFRGGNAALLGTSVQTIALGTYYYFELKVVVSTTTGSVQLRVNGVDWINVSGVNTSATTSVNTNGVYLGTGSANNNPNITINCDYDDFYSRNDGTMMGDCRVETVLPTGNGVVNNWTPLSGSNWQNVGNNPSTDDVNYNSEGTAGDIDLYTFPAITSTAGAVQAVMTVPIMKNDSAGTVTAQSVYRSGTTNYFGTTQSIGSTTYSAYPDIQATDPDTSAAWTLTAVNACQFGIKRVT